LDNTAKQFQNLLEVVGVYPTSVGSDGVVYAWSSIPNEPLAALVFASIDKPLTSPECLALQKMLGPESPEWAAYVAERDRPIKEQREQRYRSETDPLRMKLDEDFTIGSPEWLAGLEEWKLAKAKIREELPYPE
jgi:hypothetical protein